MGGAGRDSEAVGGVEREGGGGAPPPGAGKRDPDELLNWLRGPLETGARKPAAINMYIR